MTKPNKNIQESINRKANPTFRIAYKIFFTLDSISIVSYIICVIFDINIEQRKLLRVLFPWLLLLWIFLYNKAFGGVGNAIRDIWGRFFYLF